MKTLFEHVDILTENETGYVQIRDGYLGVDGATICYIGQEAPADAYDQKRNFKNKLLIPGMVNGHCHSPMTLLRGVGSDKPLQTWLFDYMFPTEDKLRPEDIRVGTQLALLEMAATGTTSFSDMYFMCDETIEACIQAGMKANIGRPVQCFDESESYADSTRAQDSFRLYNEYNGAADGKILVDFAIHAEYTCKPHIVKAYAEDCAKLGGRMHIHISETKSEHDECIGRHGKTPTQFFHDLGAMENLHLMAAHGVYLTDEDIAIIAEHHGSVMHNPTSNMKLGSGFAPIEKMVKAGVNVALGTDGAASNNNLNMFEELHLASIIHNGFNTNAEILPAQEVFAMATKNGAKMQGRENCGALVVGNRADIVAIDLDKPHLYPNFDALATLCYSVQGADVYMTMVDGEVLYENGAYLTLDYDRILFDAKKSIDYLY